MIPKTIHYCWFGPNKKSDLNIKCIESWKKYLPNFEIREWNKSNFPIDDYPFAKEAYAQGKYAFVADVARLYALQQEGGIYLDTDMEILKPIDHLLENTAFVGFESKDWVATGIIGSVPNSELMNYLLKYYQTQSFSTIPQPAILTHILGRVGFEIDGASQTAINFLTVYATDYFYPYNYYTKETHFTENTLCLHHYEGSWVNKQQEFRLPEDTEEDIQRRQKFYSQFVHPNDLVFDVGANVGNRTRPLLNIGAKIVAVEPQEECRKKLEQKFGNKITIVPMGVGETEGMKDFFVSNAHTISSFSTEWIESVKEDRFKEFTWFEPEKIQVTTLDKLIEKYGLPTFIKIDVEGYELEVLKGLTYAVDVISFEYTLPEQIQRAIDCVSQIEKYNADIECNFSISESMEFALNDWLPATELKNYISTQEFIATGFGDIYVRRKVLGIL